MVVLCVDSHKPKFVYGMNFFFFFCFQAIVHSRARTLMMIMN